MKHNPEQLVRTTVRMQMLAALFLGATMAGMQLVSTVARKSLGASDFQIMLLTMILPLCFFFSIWWSALLSRIRCWRCLFPLLGVFSALPMSLMSLSSEIRVLLALMCVYFLGQSLYIPLKNRLLQANFPPGKRSTLFSRVSTVQAAVVLVASWGIGRYLDAQPDNWRHLFLLIAVAGLVDRLITGLIPEGEQGRLEARDHHHSPPKERAAGLRFFSGGLQLLAPVRRVIRELKQNPEFFRWEMQFMLYGLGFFILLTVLPGFLVEGMELSYSTIALGQISLARFGGLLTLPLFGRLHDGHNSATYCGGVFLLLSIYPLLLFFCAYLLPHYGPLVPLLFLAFLMNGVAMSGVHMAWVLSSMSFARGRDAALYQSIHVSLTGFRGLMGPLIGWLTLEYFGWSAAFMLSFVFLLLASYLMFRQGRTLGNSPHKSEAGPTPLISRENLP